MNSGFYLKIDSNRFVLIDLLRIVGAFLVITLHAQPLRTLAPVADFAITHGVTRIAVPFFFVTSGYFLASTLHKRRFHIWAVKIVKLYALWMLLYTPFWFPDRTAGDLFYTALMGYYHLWYLSALLMAALLLFLLIRGQPTLVPVSVGAAMLLGFGLQYLYYFLPPGALLEVIESYALHRSFLTFAFPYLGIGYLIATRANGAATLTAWAPYLVALGFALLAVEVWANLTIAKRHGLSDNLISILVLTPSLFVLGLRSERTLGKLNTLLGPLSLAIYLVHIAVLYVVSTTTSLGPIGVWALTCGISTLIGALLVWRRNALPWMLG